MDLIITWLVVGLIAGASAALLVRGSGLGLLGDIVLGMVGAVVGSWTFRELGWAAPFGGGLGGTIVIALVGAVLVLAAFRVFRSLSRT